MEVPPELQDKMFEMIEDLLVRVSDAYVQKKKQLLLAKLRMPEKELAKRDTID